MPHFWGYCSNTTRWLRSGNYGSANGAYNILVSGSIDFGFTDYRLAVRPALHLFAEKIYCRQFPNSARSRTTEQLSYEMKGAIVPLAP